MSQFHFGLHKRYSKYGFRKIPFKIRVQKNPDVAPRGGKSNGDAWPDLN